MLLVSTDRELVDLCSALLRLDEPHIIVSNQVFPRKTSYILQVCDYKFRGFLEARGLTPAKTMKIGMLDIPESVFADFLRGELDSDGGWYVGKGWREVDYLIGKFTSRSQGYLEWLQKTVYRLAGNEGRLQKSRLLYNGKKAEALAEWIHYAANLPCLQRKRRVWQNWVDHKRKAARE
jgi:hypothetical protein